MKTSRLKSLFKVVPVVMMLALFSCQEEEILESPSANEPGTFDDVEVVAKSDTK